MDFRGDNSAAFLIVGILSKIVLVICFCGVVLAKIGDL